tara:strand:+ start:1483 stop:2121 length:639 start_codon:yes stop_codon:yes gene_type:complete
MNLKINEIFYSIQGESSNTGLPCIFIRLTYCNLRCSYCDTDYAFYNGTDMKISEIISEINKYPTDLVMITGGEPLLQENCIYLMQELLNKDYSVMLETSGSLKLKDVPKSVIKIVDFKCPTSSMMNKNDWTIITDIQKEDEIKFVIANKEDYDWSKKMIENYSLNKICPILFSPVYNKIDISTLASWILEDGLNVKLQMQLHKHIWGEKKGV